MKKYYIQAARDKKETVVSLLKLHLNMSEEKAHYLISIGAVWNKSKNERIKDPVFVCTGELVVVYNPEYRVPVYPFDPNDIIYDDAGFLIVYKKGKYPTVPTPYSDVNSLSFALEDFFMKKKPGKKIYVINRLDTHARGLVFFAKNKKTEKTLHRMFKERRVKKWYFAGTKVFDGVKSDYLIQDQLEWKGKKKQSKTFIHLLKKTETGFCFLVRPYTGRTHQIRKHFAGYLVPITGDPVYGNASREDSMALVCFTYIFPHPVTGVKMKVGYVPELFC